MRIRRVMILSVAVALLTPALAQAYEVGPPSKGTVEGTEQQAKEAAEKQAKENAEKKQKEEAEHQAAEARQREEAASRQQAETQSKEAEQQAAARKAEVCVVPNLKGDSVRQARAALGKAHCTLGKVVTPRHSHGRLVIASQSVKRGLTRPDGTAVAVTLGAAAKRK